MEEMAADPAVMAQLTIYNLPTIPAVWDQVGIFFIAFGVTWTVLLLSGMIFCWINRNDPVLKIRGLPLSFAAISLLHVYWILAQLVYPIGRSIPTVLAYDIQYFAMGIYFPLGIALFQAANSRFLYVAKLQKQFVHPHLREHATRCNGAKSSWLCRLRNMDYTRRVLMFIGVGMIIQFLLTVGMWLACEKYHPTYGIPGTGIKGDTLEEQIIDLGRGWEWWPSVVWQVIWCWIIAPIMLWRAWSIRDTMGWRTQTIGCCISGLHATPMFLISSYVPAFYPVNVYYPPSQWIHLSIMMIEIFTVFVPIAQLIRLRILRRKAADMNAKWETESTTTMETTSTSLDWLKSSSASLAEKGMGEENGHDWQDDRLYTMNALDHVLKENPYPLQDFSALSDFSGENIAFLTRTAEWKANWVADPTDGQLLDVYNQALAIYTDFISPHDAEFPLNISSKALKDMEAVFEKPARILCGEVSRNPATPFDEFAPPSSAGAQSNSTLVSIADKARYTGEIPSGFNMGVFDIVQSHIKYLVLTNTWPKFIEEMQTRSRRSSETGRTTIFTDTSETTLASRVSSQLSKIVPSIFLFSART